MPTLSVLLSVFHLFSTVTAGGHTLLVTATLIKGETPFPEFSAVLMLDDIQVIYYDSVTKLYVRRGPNHTDPIDNEDQKDFKTATEHFYSRMQRRILSLRDYFNKTNGIQSLQRLAACELLGSNDGGRLVYMEAFDGEGGDAVSYNQNEGSFITEWIWPFPDGLHDTLVKYLMKEIFYPLCTRLCRRYQKREKNRVEKQVKPRVRLLHKILPDSGEVKLTCLATGFYPRHINLTLLRDGRPVSDHQMTRGELLPNGDETYQMRKSLEVRAEELQHHNYTCTAEHLSLDNRITIILEGEPEPDTLPPFPLLVFLLVALVVVPISAVVALVVWRRRKTQRERSRNTQDQTTTVNSHTLEDPDTQTSLTFNYTRAPNTDDEGPAEVLSVVQYHHDTVLEEIEEDEIKMDEDSSS